MSRGRWIGAFFAPLVALAFPVAASGAGFQLQENGAKAFGMANAFTGTADDASANYFNPAALARFHAGPLGDFGEERDLVLGGMVGATYIQPFARHDTDERAFGAENQRVAQRPILVPHVWGALGFDITDTIRFGAGGGTFTPYGLTIDWGRSSPGWGGRFQVTDAAITTVEGTANVAVEVDLSDFASVAVGGGLSLVTGTVKLNRKADLERLVGPGAGEPDIKLKLRVQEDDVPWRWAISAMVRLFENRVRLGFVYRHQISDITARGRAKPSNFGPGAPAAVLAAFSDNLNRTALRVRLPGEVRLGVGWDPIDDLTINFDWRWTNHSILSTFFVRSQIPGVDGGDLEFEWRDSDYFGLGAEYRLFHFDDDGLGLALRAGLGYDETPIPRKVVDPTVPDNDRYVFTLGVGVEPIEKFRIDFSYMGIHIKHYRNRNASEFPSPSGLGKYRTWANLFQLSFSLDL